MGIKAVPDESASFSTVDEATLLLPALPPQKVTHAAQALLALEALRAPGLPGVLDALRKAAMSPHPERELVELAARWTGGFAEIRASWGDTIASAGKAAEPTRTLRLVHHERHVGALSVSFSAEWQPLTPLLAEYALLARLQSAAAGAARRRVGERMLDGLLSGQDDVLPTGLGTGAFALAVATLPPSSGDQNQPLQAQAGNQAQALDVLAAVGEGYFSERRLVGHSTVRFGQAVWLWTTMELTREARELHLALSASTALEVRLGVSARQPGGSRDLARDIQNAFGQARQAWAASAQAHHTIFQALDPLYALMADGSLNILAAQIETQLESIRDGGRVADTLRAYLGHQGTLSELAALLGIHVNTLRARLRSAEEALGARLSDPALLARLYLAFRAGSA